MTRHMTTGQLWKIAGVVVALIPIGFFLMFAIGEGPVMGWTHYVQALVPLAALALAWWNPRIGGATLVALGIVVGAWYAAEASHVQLITVALVELIAFVPLIVSGALFLTSTKYEPPHA